MISESKDENLTPNRHQAIILTKNQNNTPNNSTTMPTVPLYSSKLNTHGQKLASSNNNADPNPFPNLLQTPSGLAILELQGTMNLPAPETTIPNDVDGSDNHVDDGDNDAAEPGTKSQPTTEYETPIGRLVFSGYTPSTKPDDTTWMKRVHLYVGRHQRFTGEVKKLPKPLAMIQRRQVGRSGESDSGEARTKLGGGDDSDHHLLERGDELEISDIVKYKIIFSSRPEPVRDDEE